MDRASTKVAGPANSHVQRLKPTKKLTCAVTTTVETIAVGDDIVPS